MWKQSDQEFTQCFHGINKNCMDSTTGDSGFLSSYNSTSYSSSSELFSNSMLEDPRLISVPSMKTTDSGADFALSDSFNQLSLKQISLNALNSDTQPIDTDSGNISMTMNTENDKESCQQEPWQLYFRQNDDGDTLLYTAIIQGYFEATLSLINMAPHSCLLDILNNNAQTALHLAVITKQPKIVRRLVLAGADLTIRNHQGNTALHLACISGDLDCATALTEPITSLEANLLSGNCPSIPQNLEQRNYNGETCLHIAASRGHVNLVRLLVHHGADLEARESLAGRTALHLALECEKTQVALYLIRECKPHLDATTYSGCTAYQIASCVDERLARELVRFGATSMAYEEEANGADFREMAGFANGATAASA